MALIPPDTLDAIRSRLDLAELIREYVPDMARAGRGFKARCPFHQERSPSFIVSPERQTFHCFGCGERGDAFAFVMKIENLSFVEAVEKLAQKAGVKIERAEGPLAPEERERLRIREALEFARGHYHQALLTSPQASGARQYLATRGVSEASVKTFSLGYASANSGLLEAAKLKGFPAELLVKAGLAAVREGRTREYFYNRVLFPILDARGTVVGFGGRIMGEGEPKYLNSPESPVFSKGRVLYGLFQGLPDIRKARRAALMEGYMDVIAAHQHGLKTACAPLGTAFTPDHALLLKRYAGEATIVFDADNAGQNAALKAAAVLLAAGFGVRVADVPEGKDPDEFLKSGDPAVLARLFEEGPDPAEFHAALALKRLGGAPKPEDKARLAKEILATINFCTDEIPKSEWVRRLARRLQIDEDSILREFQKVPAPRPFPARPAVRCAPVPVLSPGDKQILGLLFNDRTLAASLQENDFDSPIAVRAWKALSAQAGASASGWSTAFLDALAPEDRPLVSSMLAEDIRTDDPGKSLGRLLDRRRKSARLKEIEPRILGMGSAHPWMKI